MITLITGENEYAIKQHVDSLIDKFVEKHGAEGIEKYRGEDIERSDIPDLLGGVSLFSSERLVIVDQPEKSKELTEHLAEHIESISGDIKLVLVEPKPDKRKRWHKAVSKHGELVEKFKLSPQELNRWVVQTVKEKGGNIDTSSARFLIERAGTNQWQLHNEINKLLSSGLTISTESIEELVEPTLDETVFQLLDAAVQGDEERALKLYEELSKRDLDPHQTVSMLGWQVHNMLLVKTNMNTSPGELASKGGMAPFVVRKTRNLVRKLHLRQIKQLINLILQAESDLKTTGMDAHRRTMLLISQVARATS